MPQELSGGMARRASLALQLAQRKRVVVLDEPFTGLDEAAARAVAAELASLRSKHGAALLLVSHQPSLVKLVAEQPIVVELRPASKNAPEPPRRSYFGDARGEAAHEFWFRARAKTRDYARRPAHERVCLLRDDAAGLGARRASSLLRGRRGAPRAAYVPSLPWLRARRIVPASGLHWRRASRGPPDGLVDTFRRTVAAGRAVAAVDPARVRGRGRRGGHAHRGPPRAPRRVAAGRRRPREGGAPARRRAPRQGRAASAEDDDAPRRQGQGPGHGLDGAAQGQARVVRRGPREAVLHRTGAVASGAAVVRTPGGLLRRRGGDDGGHVAEQAPQNARPVAAALVARAVVVGGADCRAVAHGARLGPRHLYRTADRRRLRLRRGRGRRVLVPRVCTRRAAAAASLPTELGSLAEFRRSDDVAARAQRRKSRDVHRAHRPRRRGDRALSKPRAARRAARHHGVRRRGRTGCHFRGLGVFAVAAAPRVAGVNFVF
mmetsp:Transcript_33855/g.104829  ORF Transcript_33855/g.104829 Transcript_33855/m.104829 type:complete len:491 (+) Transcript_33855:520-1992(+)